jgi:hypothetical protein
MAANGISTLSIPSGLTATSYTQASSYLVAVGTFNYDAYGAGFAIRKDGGAIDAYMAQVIALPGAGARNWTFVPANGQPSFTRSMNEPDGTNESNDPSESGVDIWNVTTAAGNLSGASANQINISLIPNGTSFVIYATELGGGGGADKEARQTAKLDLAQNKRRGYTLNADGTIASGPDTTKVFYRENNTYDLALLPDTFATTGDDNANTGGLIVGRPWLNIAGITFAANIWRTDYELYFNDDPAFFDTAALKAAPNDYNGTDTTISEPSLLNNTSIQYKGYFLATYTGTHTFYLNSDDGSYLWIGLIALSGYTTANALVQNGGLHALSEVSATINLVAGTYYPIRIQFGNGPDGPGELIASYAHSGQAKTSTWTGKVFYNTATNGF